MNKVDVLGLLKIPTYKVKGWDDFSLPTHNPIFNNQKELEITFTISDETINKLYFDISIYCNDKLHMKTDKFSLDREEYIINISKFELMTGNEYILDINYYYNNKESSSPIRTNKVESNHINIYNDSKYIILLDEIDKPKVSFKSSNIGNSLKNTNVNLITNILSRNNEIGDYFLIKNNKLVEIDTEDSNRTIFKGNNIGVGTLYYTNKLTSVNIKTSEYIVPNNSLIKTHNDIGSGIFYNKGLDKFGIVSEYDLLDDNQYFIFLNGRLLKNSQLIKTKQKNIVLLNDTIVENDVLIVKNIVDSYNINIKNNTIPMNIKVYNTNIHKGVFELKLSNNDDEFILEIPYKKGKNEYVFNVNFDNKGEYELVLKYTTQYTTIKGKVLIQNIETPKHIINFI